MAGIYIFAAQRGGTAEWYAIYIGQCESFANRLPGHEKGTEAILHGASAIHVLAIPTQEARDSLELHLIQTYQPVLNKQHR